MSITTRKRSRSTTDLTIFDKDMYEHLSKKQKINKDKSENEEHDSEEDLEGELEEEFISEKKKSLMALFAKKERVHRRENHVYFNCDVTNDSINQLEKVLGDICSEYRDFKEYVDSKTKYLATFEQLEPKPIYLHITSNGGSLLHGFRCIDIMKSCKIPIHTVIDGYAISAGSLMAVSGEKRYMNKNAHMLIHQLSSSNKGKYHDLVDDYTNNKSLMDRIVNIYKHNSTMTKKKIEGALKHDLYWDAETCLEYGLIDEIYEGDKTF
jgi:ATP-dependent protease ClpP protease subunit